MRPTGIGETLCQAMAKFVRRAAGYQAKTARGNFQLCAGVEAGIEGATHAVRQRRLERSRVIQSEEEARRNEEEESGCGDRREEDDSNDSGNGGGGDRVP